MTINYASVAAARVANLLIRPIGADFSLNQIAQSLGAVIAVQPGSVMVGNTSAELFEQGLTLRYPTVTIFCEKLTNSLKEKFRTFSGVAQVSVDVRHSQEQVQNVQSALETYVTAVCNILDSSRGDWGNGMFYAGGYTVTFSPTKRGGRNYLQSARISVEVDISN